MTETEKKHRSRAASPTVMELTRHLVLDCCLRDRMRYYHQEDLVEAYSLRVNIVQWARDVLRINNAINEY